MIFQTECKFIVSINNSLFSSFQQFANNFISNRTVLLIFSFFKFLISYHPHSPPFEGVNPENQLLLFKNQNSCKKVNTHLYSFIPINSVSLPTELKIKKSCHTIRY